MKLFPGCRFVFGTAAAWQFWKRGSGIARVIEIDETVAHVQVIGVGPSVIAHLPILRSLIEPVARNVVADSSIGDDEIALRAVEEWKFEYQHGEAGIFSVPLHEAVAMIYRTAPDLSGDEYVETAYPVRDGDGTFRTVRIITAPAEAR